MAIVEHELLSFDRIKNVLLALCTEGQSGDFCLFTKDKHAAVISINDGDIVGLRYRISRGNDALKLIKSIDKAKVRFQKKDSNTSHSDMTRIPSTVEILQTLGIELNETVLQEFGKKILVVEDSTTQRNIICKMLSQNGYRVLEASDGVEALEKLEKTRADLVLLDIVLPGMDGYKVLNAIKEMKHMKNVPIIMLTSRDSLIDKMRGKVSDSDEYLTKPFKSEELIEKVNKYLSTENSDFFLSEMA